MEQREVVDSLAEPLPLLRSQYEERRDRDDAFVFIREFFLAHLIDPILDQQERVTARANHSQRTGRLARSTSSAVAGTPVRYSPVTRVRAA